MVRTIIRTNGIKVVLKAEVGVPTIIVQDTAIAMVVDQLEVVITITIEVAVPMEVRPPGL